MLKKEMSIKEFIEQPEIKTLIEIIDENVDEFVDEINKTGKLI